MPQGKRYRLTSPEGESEVHMAAGHGDYMTACGYDNESEEPVETREKITCVACTAIWTAARLYRVTDFAALKQ